MSHPEGNERSSWVPPMDEASLFDAAIKLPPEQRHAFLERACGGNAAVRQLVIDLIASHEQARADFLHPTLLGGFGGTIFQPPESVGTQIGPYTLGKQIGAGGFGVVFQAEQSVPVKRQVALKILKPGMDTAEVVARFESERQALALMDHPHIAKVYDAGTTDTGRPYFVMELVAGIPVTRFCDQHRLTIRQRIELFVAICQAVQHAHVKGIVHRDIKPSNVLVLQQDGQPVPKVIDFGIAKAIDQPLTEQTLATRHGQVMGTPQYMSPEQAFGEVIKIDTRSDIYSLGVLLYELLTGTTPIPREGLPTLGLEEIQQIIREVDPPSPSTRLTAATKSLETVAQVRREDARGLVQRVRGELDWIVMKALEKEQSRRYQSAMELAADLRRHLTGEAVEASPQSNLYRVRKFVRRHRPVVVAASLVLLALITGVAGLTWGLLHAAAALRSEGEQRQVAEAAELLAKQRLEQLRQQKKHAVTQANAARQAELAARDAQADSEKFSNFLIEVVLAAARPRDQRHGQGKDVSLSEAIIGAEKVVDDWFEDRPIALAKTLHSLGNTLRQLGRLEIAERYLRRAVALREEFLAQDHEDMLRAKNSLAVLLYERGKFQEALPLFEKVHSKVGEDHLTLRVSLGAAYRAIGQAETALPLLENVYDTNLEEHGPDHWVTQRAANELSLCYDALGQTDKALSLTKDCYISCRSKLGPTHRMTLESMHNLAGLYVDVGQFVKAEKLYKQAAQSLREIHGPRHYRTLTVQQNLGVLYQKTGRLQQALPIFKESVRVCREELGPDHPKTLLAMTNLAILHGDLGRPALAVQILEGTLKLRRNKLGAQHPDTLSTMNALGVAYWKDGRLTKSVPLLEQAYRSQVDQLGLLHPKTIETLSNLVDNCRDIGQPSRGKEALEKTLKLSETELGVDHPRTLEVMSLLGVTYWRLRSFNRAIPLFEDLLSRQQRLRGHNHPHTFRTVDSLVTNYCDAGQLPQARKTLEQAQSLYETQLGRDHPRTLEVMSRLGVIHWRLRSFNQSVPLYEELLRRQQRVNGRNHPDTMTTLGNLVVNYCDSGQSKLAVPLFEQIPAAIPEQLTLPARKTILQGYFRVVQELRGREQWSEIGRLCGKVLAVTGDDLSCDSQRSRFLLDLLRVSKEMSGELQHRWPGASHVQVALARFKVCHRQWETAADVYSRIQEPTVAVNSEHALVAWLAGDVETARTIGQDLASLAERRPHSANLSLLSIRTLTLTAPDVVPADDLLAWSRRWVQAEANPATLQTQALAEFRARDYVQSRKSAQLSLDSKSDALHQIQAQFLLAMIHHHSREESESQRLFQQAQQALKNVNSQHVKCAKIPDWLIAVTLGQQAAALLNQSPGSDSRRRNPSEALGPEGQQPLGPEGQQSLGPEGQQSLGPEGQQSLGFAR